MSRSRGRAAGHAVRPWTGAAQFSVTASSLSIALDAAHIRWVQAAGSDEEANDLDLCVLHHKPFDRGRAVPSAACCC